MLRFLPRPRPQDAIRSLEADPGTWDSPTALRLLQDLLLERSGEDSSGASNARAREVDARLTELDRARGRERLLAARRGGGEKAADGLSAAQDAAEVFPESAEARRLIGWFSLRKGDVEGAAKAFQAAIERSDDRAGERRRIETYYRLLGRSPATLEAPAP